MHHFKSFAFLMLLISCSLYSYWLSNRDYEWIVPYMNDRAPAAVRESKDFQQIVEKPMRVFKREAVVSSILIDSHKGEQKISFGQFPVVASKGPNLICLEYPYLHLVLVGEGAAVAGKKTQVTVSAPCQVNPKNRDRVSDIPLPFEEIYRRPAQDQNFIWRGPAVDVNVLIENVYGEWPRLWELESIEFYKDSEGAGDKVVLSKSEFLKLNGEPFLIHF
jgi:hypothetical protein